MGACPLTRSTVPGVLSVTLGLEADLSGRLRPPPYWAWGPAMGGACREVRQAIITTDGPTLTPGSATGSVSPISLHRLSPCTGVRAGRS